MARARGRARGRAGAVQPARGRPCAPSFAPAPSSRRASLAPILSSPPAHLPLTPRNPRAPPPWQEAKSPAILEIPSKEFPYDADQDAIHRRTKLLLGIRD